MTSAERRQRDARQRRHDEARDRGRRFCLATAPGDAHNPVGAIPAAVAAPSPIHRRRPLVERWEEELLLSEDMRVDRLPEVDVPNPHGEG